MCWVDAIQLADDCCLRLAVGGLALSLLALGGLLAARLLRLAAKSLRRSCGITGCVFFLIFAAVSSVVAQKGSTNGPAALPPRMMAGAPPLADIIRSMSQVTLRGPKGQSLLIQ